MSGVAHPVAKFTFGPRLSFLGDPATIPVGLAVRNVRDVTTFFFFNWSCSRDIQGLGDACGGTASFSLGACVHVHILVCVTTCTCITASVHVSASHRRGPDLSWHRNYVCIFIFPALLVCHQTCPDSSCPPGRLTPPPHTLCPTLPRFAPDASPLVRCASVALANC